jgi:hypothetical protein
MSDFIINAHMKKKWGKCAFLPSKKEDKNRSRKKRNKLELVGINGGKGRIKGRDNGFI